MSCPSNLSVIASQRNNNNTCSLFCYQKKQKTKNRVFPSLICCGEFFCGSFFNSKSKQSRRKKKKEFRCDNRITIGHALARQSTYVITRGVGGWGRNYLNLFLLFRLRVWGSEMKRSKPSQVDLIRWSNHFRSRPNNESSSFRSFHGWGTSCTHTTPTTN